MKPSKSLTSVASQQHHQLNGSDGYTHRKQPQPPEPKGDPYSQQHQHAVSNSAPTSPICRCRVMYLGSSVPHITKDGLQGIQEPLRELYPDKASLSSGNAGIDSWLSVWSNGILIENVDETGREVKRFFKIEALHYCAAVKYVPQVFAAQNINGNATLPHNLASLPKFLPLDSPHTRMQQDINSNPPVFASILRRTTGVKVLECHAFICKREAAANALVRCCFHAYADTMYAKQIGAEVDSVKLPSRDQNGNQLRGDERRASGAMSRRSKSIAALNEATDRPTDSNSQQGLNQADYSQTMCHPRRKSLSSSQQANYPGESDASDGCASQRHPADRANLQLDQMKRFSKSMHQLNQPQPDQNGFMQNGCVPTEPIFTNNPYASRVPSYPPQNIIDQQQQQQQQLQAINGGTLRSVKSMAANSIASTLLRSKKHAKAMSMAQLNQPPNAMLMATNQPMSFHQFQQSQQYPSNTFMTMPPVPPMFLPRPDMNGSQTMKLPSRSMLQAMPPVPMNFEAMTPKEMKKLLKKSAKYGINPAKFADNGLPLLPLRTLPVPLGAHLQPGLFAPPPPPPPPPLHGLSSSEHSGTLNSQSVYGVEPNSSHQNQPFDVADYAGATNMQQPYCLGPSHPMMDPAARGPPQPIKSILVKPNPEFLKSKAGKKWLKQQKEFKKLLPAHLDGLPIVFGPPPIDALETANGSNLPASGQHQVGPPPPPPLVHPFMSPPSHLVVPQHMSTGGLPMLDSSGFYNSHPLYGPSGRASAASTMLRHSPQVAQQHLLEEQADFLQRGHHHHHHHNQQSMYSNPVPMMGPNSSMQMPLPPPPPPMLPPHQQLSADELYGHHKRHQQLSNGSHGGSSRQRRRNHMVEQSVISLGDEEDGEPSEEADEQEAEDEYERAYDEQSQRSQKNGYYNRVDGYSGDHHEPRPRKATNGYDPSSVNYQDDYEQINQLPTPHQPGDERRNGNTTGIYRRRGHINERAFSYSIRQETSKSSADNSDAEYRNGDLSDTAQYQHASSNHSNSNNINNNHIDYRLGNQSGQHLDPAHYENPQRSNIYQNKPPMQCYKKQAQPPMLNHRQQQHQHQQQQPVDELSARLESQLNMKSFANSCVKSNM